MEKLCQAECLVILAKYMSHVEGPGRLLNKVFYGEAPPGASNPYTPFTYLEQNCTPFLRLKDKLKQ